MNGASYISSPVPALRPSFQSMGRSASNGGYGEDETWADTEAGRTGDESDTVSVMAPILHKLIPYRLKAC